MTDIKNDKITAELTAEMYQFSIKYKIFNSYNRISESKNTYDRSVFMSKAEMKIYDIMDVDYELSILYLIILISKNI
jgi:hypothetical protein